MRRALAIGVSSLALLLSACASTIAPRPELISAGVAEPVVQGKATIVLPTSELNKTITQHPTSYTGSATTITVPSGEILRAGAQKVFSRGFSGGADVSENPTPGTFSIFLNFHDFSFAYDQLSNLGFAITPKVSVSLDASATAPNGAKIYQKTLRRTDVSPGKYAVSGHPAELINVGLHQALGDMLREILDDIAREAKK